MTRRVSFERAFKVVAGKRRLAPSALRRFFRVGYETLIYYHSLRLLARREGFNQTPFGIASYLASRKFDFDAVRREIESYADRLGGLEGLAVKYGYTPFIVHRLSEFLDEGELEEVLGSLNTRKRWLRVNTLAATVKEAVDCLVKHGLRFEASKYTDLSYKILGDVYSPVSSIECVEKGILVPQDVSSVLSVLAGRPYERSVLDACSAPGVKLQLVLSLYRDSTAVAVDYSPKRVKYVYRVLSKYGGLDRAVIINGDSTIVDYYRVFEKAIVDAPCTGSGAVYSDPTVKVRFSPAELKSLTKIQTRLLRRALANSRSVLYITCSVLPEEGEAVVDEVLREGLAEPVRISERFLSKAYKGFKSSDYTYRIMPNVVDGQGMYLALLDSRVFSG
ncbi:MAG: hypothetical protein ACP5HP_05010 [Thermogladius sp.]